MIKLVKKKLEDSNRIHYASIVGIVAIVALVIYGSLNLQGQSTPMLSSTDTGDAITGQVTGGSPKISLHGQSIAQYGKPYYVVLEAASPIDESFRVMVNGQISSSPKFSKQFKTMRITVPAWRINSRLGSQMVIQVYPYNYRGKGAVSYQHVVGLTNSYVAPTNPLPAVTTNWPAPPKKSLDLNGDGVVNVMDMQMVINHINSGSSCPVQKCDVTGDGAVNVVDLQTIINKLMGR